MLQWIRNVGQNKFGKIFTIILFGLIIGGFALLGIADVFRGTPPTTIVSVGKTEISRFSLQQAIDNYITNSAREQRPVTREEIRTSGLGIALLNQLVTQAFIDEAARRMDLGAPVETVRQVIMYNPAFHSDGSFDPIRFASILSESRIPEAAYVAEQQILIPRQQVLSAIRSDDHIPAVKQKLFWRLQNEKRTIQSVLISHDDSELKEPDDSAITEYYEKHKNRYTVEARRDVNILSISPTNLANHLKVSDDDIRAAYEKNKETMLNSGSRAYEQLAFNSEQQAQEAEKKLQEGASFETLIAEYKDISGVTHIPAGTEFDYESIALLDKNLASVLFSLQLNTPSPVFNSLLGHSIIRVTHIKDPEVIPFEIAREELTQRLLAERSGKILNEMHDKIEEQLGGGKSVADAAKDLDLPLVTLTQINKEGKTSDGKDEAKPYSDIFPDFLKQAFNLETGRDSGEILTNNGGYIWFEITKISPERTRELDEIKDEVIAQWNNDTLMQMTNQKAEAYLTRIREGESLANLAQELQTEIRTISGISRQKAIDDLPPISISLIFATRIGEYGTFSTNAGTVLFEVTAVEVPPFSLDSFNAEVKQKIAKAQIQDEDTEFMTELHKEFPMEQNDILINQIIGMTE